MNKAILSGRLGKDPELKYTQSGKAVCVFSMATQDGKDKKTEWHRVVCWERIAENVAQYLGKGSGALVEGRIQTREWDDSDGNKRRMTEIVAYSVEFWDKRSESAGAGGSNSPAEIPPAPSGDDEDTLPF